MLFLRERSLTMSCDELPTCLGLVRYNEKSNEAIGHARIAFLPNIDRAVWIESVVIHHDLRGKGYGRILMTRTENYAKSLGFTSAYLSTHDQQVFYGKLGYEFCKPVTTLGGVINKSFIPKKFIIQNHINNNTEELSKLNLNDKKCDKENVDDSAINNCDDKKTRSSSSITVPPPPPPPPSFNKPQNKLPKLSKSDIERIDPSKQVKMFMRKDL